MRNLIIAGAVLTSAVLITVYQRSVLGNTRRDGEVAAVRNDSLQSEIAGQRGEVKELEGRRAIQEEKLSRAGREINTVRMAQEAVPTGTPTPATEGFWPETRPYFYLAKKHIPGIDYNTFSLAGRISEEAVALFGISAAERRSIEEATQRMFARLQEAERKSFALTNNPSDVSGKSGTKISVHVPANPEASQMREEVALRIGEILGGERATLFLERAAEGAKQFDSFSKADRIVTLIPKDEDKGEIIVTTDSGSMFNYYDRAQPLDWMMFQYGHLIDAFAPRGE